MTDVTKPTITPVSATKPTGTPVVAAKPFSIMQYVQDKVKKEPRLVWIKGEDHIINGAHIFTIADNSNWANTASISTDGLQGLTPQSQMAIMDMRFQQVLDTLFGKGNVV